MVDSRTKSGKKSHRSPRLLGGGRGAPARSGTLRLVLVLGALVLLNLYVFLWRSDTSVPAVMKKANAMPAEGAAPAPVVPTPAIAAGDQVAAGDVAAPAPAPAATVIEGEVSKGDSLGKLLRKNGLSAPEADELLRALSEVFDFKTLRPGQKFKIERTADGQVSAFELAVSKVKTVRVERDAAGELVGVADVAQTRIEVEEVAARIDSSLYASIKGAGEETSLVAFFVDVFAYDLDFYVDTHPGDVFRVLVEKEYTQGAQGTEFLRYRRILAAEYDGKEGTFRAIYWQSPGSKRPGRYFDDKGRSVEKSLLKTPLKYARISSKFNPRRMHPVLHRVRGHFGVDYAAPTGTPVWAAASGTIVTRAPSGGAGNLVVLRHDDGLVTKYMHLSKFAKNQKVGQRVEAKTVIGYVGTTGLSTGPHLHFGVTKNGRHVDPLSLAPTRAAGVPKADLAAYKDHVAGTLGRMAAIPLSVPVADPAGPALAAEDEVVLDGQGGPEDAVDETSSQPAD